MGARLRLKASIDVTGRTTDPNMQKIFRAMQKHGLIVADNGSDMYITGTYDQRWDNDVLNPAFSKLTAGDFEIVQLGYNPAKPTVGPVRHLRAALVGKALTLAWDRETSGVKYRVQGADQIGAPVWQTLAETSEYAWSGPVNATARARFFRVLFVTE